jgi:GTP cyclohydrolase II
MLTLIKHALRRIAWNRLYRNRPETLTTVILQRTAQLERLGPIILPLEVKGHSEPVDFHAYYFGSYDSGDDYIALTPGSWSTLSNPLLRISSNCIWAFAFSSVRCDCRWEFEEAKRRAVEEPSQNAVLIFAASQHGKAVPGGIRGHALIYALGQAAHQDLVYAAYTRNGFELDYRSYADVAMILRECGIDSIRLLTNNPERVKAINREGILVERVPLEKPYVPWDSEELGVKKARFGHLLDLPGFTPEDVMRYDLDPADVFQGPPQGKGK